MKSLSADGKTIIFSCSINFNYSTSFTNLGHALIPEELHKSEYDDEILSKENESLEKRLKLKMQIDDNNNNNTSKSSNEFGKNQLNYNYEIRKEL